MRYLFVSLSLMFLLRQSPQGETKETKQPSAASQRGSEESPVFVKQIPSPKTQEESAQDAKERADKTKNDRKLVEFTGILALLGFLQLVVFSIQSYYLRKTVQAAGEQAEDMKRAITESARSATAVEKVAQHLESSICTAIEQSKSLESTVRETARFASAMERAAEHIAASSEVARASVNSINQQMRAYLVVDIGSAVYQDRANNKKFQAIPSIVNAGLTPAHKVSFIARAAILPNPLPDDFAFPLPDAPSGTSVIGPRQTITICPIVDDFCDDGDVEAIKAGNQGQGLYTWGVFTYEDIFGKPQYAKFCQLYTWFPDGKTWGYFANRHNEISK
jgi:hypothetical protein